MPSLSSCSNPSTGLPVPQFSYGFLDPSQPAPVSNSHLGVAVELEGAMQHLERLLYAFPFDDAGDPNI